MKPVAVFGSEPVRPKTSKTKISVFRNVGRLLAASLSFSTTLLIGACVQGLLLLLVPRIWMLLPAIAILVSRFAHTLAITFALAPNPHLNRVIPYPVTAIIPDTDDALHPESDAKRKQITIQILRLRPNHPLGFFAPKVRQLGDFGKNMAVSLEQNAPDNGFLGTVSYNASTATGTTEILWITYWRSLEDTMNFASASPHSEVMSWWRANAEDLKHVGIGHEVYQADASTCENVSINLEPIGLGATSFFRKGSQLGNDVLPDQWINPLVDARRGPLRTAAGRLGWSNDATKEAMDQIGSPEY